MKRVIQITYFMMMNVTLQRKPITQKNTVF